MKEMNLRLDDGRNLEVFLGEGTSQHAVILHHGGATSGYVMKGEVDFLSSIGIKALAYSRAGYSSSDRKKGRRVIAVKDDITQVLNQLNIESFSSIGHSAGGSHALSTALDSRCKSIVTLASNAEFGHDNFDYFEGVDPENIAGYKKVIQDPEAFEMDLAKEFEDFHTNAENVQKRSPRFFSKKDIEIRQDIEYATIVAEAVNRGISNGVGGRVDDIIALTSPWGFDISEIHIPVLVLHGTDDHVVPQQHAQWISAHLRNSTLKFFEGYGHFGLFSAGRPEILELLATNRS